MKFLSEDNARKYLLSFDKEKKADFDDMFPAAGKDAIDFLERTC